MEETSINTTSVIFFLFITSVVVAVYSTIIWGIVKNLETDFKFAISLQEKVFNHEIQKMKNEIYKMKNEIYKIKKDNKVDD